MPTYDFRCAMGHVTERRAGYDQSAIGCPVCGAEARRASINQFGMSGFATPPMRSRPVEAAPPACSTSIAQHSAPGYLPRM